MLIALGAFLVSYVIIMCDCSKAIFIHLDALNVSDTKKKLKDAQRNLVLGTADFLWAINKLQSFLFTCLC